MIKSVGLKLANDSLMRFNYRSPESKRKPAQDRWLLGKLAINKNGNRIFVCHEYCRFIKNKNFWGIFDWTDYETMTPEEYVLWKLENA